MDYSDDEEYTWFFGHPHKTKVPSVVPRYHIDAPSSLILGNDMTQELMSSMQLPSWDHYNKGNAYVPHLGIITMPQIDWGRWIDGCYMTVVRIGKSSSPRKSRTGWRMERGEPERYKRRRLGRCDDQELDEEESEHADEPT